MLSAQSDHRAVRGARHPPDPVPAGARRRRPRRRLLPHQARQEERRVRGASRPRHRERVSRHRPGLCRERADADRLRRPAAGAAICAAGVPRRRGLQAGHQMVGAGAFAAGAAGPDAPRLPRHALGQGRPGADRDARRGGRGRVQGRARLHAGAGAARGARSGRGEEGRADAARGQEPGAVGRAGRALRRGRRRRSRRSPS